LLEPSCLDHRIGVANSHVIANNEPTAAAAPPTPP
jgi:hypothetical protein